MKGIIVSIKPEWIEKIANKGKTIEIRKTAPKVPFKAYIYATGSGLWTLCLDRSEDAYEKVCLTANCRSKEESARNYNLELVSGRVVGEFTCEAVEDLCNMFEGERPYHLPVNGESCLTLEEIEKYGQGKRLYGWHIKDLVIYDKPKELSDFKGRTKVWRGMNHVYAYEPVKRPPQNWIYVEEG